MITVYTREGCGPCHTLIYWLNRKGIEYEEIKYEENPEAYPAQFRIFPLVRVGDEFIQGLNIKRLVALI